MTNEEISAVESVLLPTSVEGMSLSKLKRLTGQVGDISGGGGFPRLSVNHSSEDDTGKAIPRGFYLVKNTDGSMVLAPEVYYRPFVRAFMYSVWDNEANQFSKQTIQARSMNDLFYDTAGGVKCGKLLPDQVKALGENSPESVVQKNIRCSQVLYGLISMPNGQDVDGNPASVVDVPSIWYVRGSSFIRISDWIKGIESQNKLMPTAYSKLTTVKGKRGNNIFYGSSAEVIKFVKFSKSDEKTLLDFFRAINAFNKGIMEHYSSSSKLKDNAKDSILEARLNNGSNT